MKERLKKFVKISSIIICIIIIFIGIAVSAFVFSCYKSSNLQSVSINGNPEKYVILDSENNSIFETENNYIPINKLNQNTINAFVSIEDKAFFSHNGVNYKRMLKAGLNNLKNLSFSEGASTITQQLIKNKYLSNKKSIERKLNEIFLAKKLEKKYSKSEILEDYLNIIYFGHGCYGIETASQFYFNKSAENLSLNESAILASIIKSPSYYSPINNPENCTKRKNLVLKEMRDDNKISEVDYESAINSSISLNLNDEAISESINDIYLNNYILNEACNILNVSVDYILKNKLKIKTTINSKYQEQLKKQISNEKNVVANNYGNKADGLGIIIDNKTNKVLAIYSNSPYDVYSVKRQPGSAIKPVLVYAPAFEVGYSPMSKILDEPINIKGYKPTNLGGINYGYVSIEDAIAKSLNIPAVKVMEDLGLGYCKKYAEKLGIKFSKNDNSYAIALGGFDEGITLRELTNAYTSFADLGQYKDSYIIDEIRNSENVLIYKNNVKKEKVINDDVAYLITSTLENAVKNGTSKKLNSLNLNLAGKTGTVCVKNSNLNTDCYSIAYNPNVCVGIWLGNYSLKKEYMLEGNNNGGTYATEIVKYIFEGLNIECENFIVPDSVEKVPINEYEYEYNSRIYLDDINGDNSNIALFSKRYLPKCCSGLNDVSSLISYSVESSNVYVEVAKNRYINNIDVVLKNESGKTVIANVNNNEKLFVFNNLGKGKYNIIVKYYDTIDKNNKIIDNNTIYIANKNKKWYM